MHSLIRNIADTALWVAVYRADESDRPDAVFHDPFARRLAGERGEQIVQAMESGRKNSWSFIARTYLFDEFILQHVNAGYDTVINLACGLDTRVYRLPLPSTLTWIDVDLPDMINYMQSMMINEKPKCNHERIAVDLSDRKERTDLFRQLENRGEKILVVTEGLMVYLEESDAGAFAVDLSRVKKFRHWVNDIYSPGILPLIQQEIGSLLKDSDSQFRFAPVEGEDFFLHFNWCPIESRSKLKTAANLKRLSAELMEYASRPEPVGPKYSFPWSGVCLFENISR